ncbi:MAG: alkaline phosphatase family protein [Acidobacteriaceae bacterium]|nr:alkaline phosphatase family protein [Acidobacteriaceae bacterium]
MSARHCLKVTFLSLVCLPFFAQSPASSALKPKLVVGIIIDQFRYDYLTRFRADYHGGLDQLMSKGADFTNANYAQVPTVTAVGHSIFMSGAMPSVSGIVGNAWYDRGEQKIVTSVCDWKEKIVGGPTEPPGPKCTDSDPASPRRLLVSTLGDELRAAHPDSKIVGISIKPRGAVLPSAHRAAGAFWFDDATGHFVSSTFYMKQLPNWAAAFNERKLPAKYTEQEWAGFPSWKFHPRIGHAPYEAIPASPWGNELIEAFAESAINGEQLGQRGGTDLLTISFSSNDYVGHRVGPDAPEVRDMAIRTDQLIGKLFHLLDEKIGMKNVMVVLSADHGVAPIPQQGETARMPGGYIAVDPEEIVESALAHRFGNREWLIRGVGETSLYLNRETMADAKTDGHVIPESEIYTVAAHALLAAPQLHAARVYTRPQLENGITGDFIARDEMNGFYAPRSGDLALVLEPNYMPGTSGTTHFSPYVYDTHVPVLFMGPGIRAGQYDGAIQPNDIAPTLASMLGIQTPSGSSGRVLTEMLLH